MSTLDNIQINFVTDSDGNPIQKVESGDPSSAGSVTDIVNSQLFTQNFELNQEQLENATPFNWWGTRDLELYLPFVKFKVNGDSTDGGHKIYMLDDSSAVGQKVFAAFNESDSNFKAPKPPRDTYSDPDVNKFWSNHEKGYLPQYDGNEMSYVDNLAVEQYQILSILYRDDAGGDTDGHHILFPNNFFKPFIYEPASDGSIIGIRNYDSSGPGQGRNSLASFEINFETSQNNYTKNAWKQGASRGDWFLTGIDRSDQEAASANEYVDNMFNVNKYLNDWDILNDFNNETAASRDEIVLNSVMPYVRGLLCNNVSEETLVNGGTFSQSTNDPFLNIDESDVAKAGAFGRNNFDGGLSVTDAFDTNVENFSNQNNQAGNGHYMILVQTSFLHNDYGSDDTTDCNWYMVQIDKKVVYDFLQDKRAQYLCLGAKWDDGSRDFYRNTFTPGMYDRNFNRVQGFGINGKLIKHSRRDNMGEGDEWKDERSPNSHLREMAIVFRKPMPLDETEMDTLDVDYSPLQGSYDRILAEQRFSTQFNVENIQRYVNTTDALDRYNLSFTKEKNFGLFAIPEQPFVNDLDYSPGPITYSVNDSANIVNQVYYKSGTEESILASAPGTVGVVMEVYKNNLPISNDISDYTVVDNLDENDLVFTDDPYHIVDSNNIGYKFAVLDYGSGDRDYDNALGLLESFSISAGAGLRVYRQNIYKFVDRLKYNNLGSDLELNNLSSAIVTPGLKNCWVVSFNYHLRSDGTIQPLVWKLTRCRYFLGIRDYFQEDFSDIGGPGFTTLPWPNTTPVISGLSKSSDYIRTLDDISDADLFTGLQAVERAQVKKAIENEELGDYIGQSDVGQVRIFKEPVRLSQSLNISMRTDTNMKYLLNTHPKNTEYWNGVFDSYPAESDTTEVFINDSPSQYKKKCVVEINPGVATGTLHRDSSGNENKGILIGDYRLNKESLDDDLVRTGLMKLPRVGTNKRAF